MIQDDWWPETGGGPIHVEELSIALAKEFNHEIDIYTRALRKDGESYTELETYADGNVRLHRLKPTTEYWNPIGRATSMATPIPQLLTEEFDIVHGHTFLPAVPTRVAGALTDASTLLTVHGTTLTTGIGRDDDSPLASLKLWIERQLVLTFNYDHVISVNQEHLDLLGNHHDHFSCVPNGVDLERFNTDVERRDEILFLGRLVPRKRVNDLVDGFAQVAEELPDTDLVIVGSGPEEETLRSLARKRGIADRVSFEGRVPDEAIPEYYRRASVFVLPSIWEGHPLTLLEAWASETPVITTEAEGIEEFVNHEETGYLVPLKSPDSIAEGLRRALSDPGERNRWAANAYELAKTEYSWDGVAERTNRIYEEIEARR
ncbi:glycosyltransferase family 4 protein [Natronobiforma cellulositropha]|uniref:glycosyltransferase family 4 protein n=1 Tax=Natronobiforma cellulositropha TaxID=1679076 RepID=UPI0021D59AF3|nr:glycosyltransferase family 4 protein [Natronobiforma cellulositropha]